MDSIGKANNQTDVRIESKENGREMKMTTADTHIGATKPLLLRVIFILNALKILLTLGFFVAFKFYAFEAGSLRGDSAANLMLLTGLGYALTFAAIVASILNRNLTGMRAAIIADFAVSIPATAFIGFAIAVVSMALTFTRPVRAYFAYRG